jgi:hypothetical protein
LEDRYQAIKQNSNEDLREYSDRLIQAAEAIGKSEENDMRELKKKILRTCNQPLAYNFVIGDDTLTSLALVCDRIELLSLKATPLSNSRSN